MFRPDICGGFTKIPVGAIFLSQFEAKTVLYRPAMGTMVDMVQLGLFFVCMFILTGAPIDFLVKTAGIAPTHGLGIFWWPLLILAIFAAIFHPIKIIQGALSAPMILVLAAAVMLSCIWSVDRASSLKETMFFLASIAAALYVAKQFSIIQLLNVFALLFAGLAVLTILLALGLPHIGVMQEIHPGAWSGPWIDKNTMGRFFVVSFAVALGRLGNHPPSWASSLLLALVSVALVFMSTSKTALLGVILVSALVCGVFIMRRGPLIAMVFAWVSAMGIAAMIAVMIFAPSVVFGLLGRDSTLTSRTQIWAASERLISQRPVKGFGYGAVWNGRSASSPVVLVHQELDFKPVNAHSSWKDARLETGQAGFWALVLAMVFALGAALFSIPWSKSAYWTLPTLAMLLQTSFAESVLLGSHDTESFLFILLSVLAAGAVGTSVRRPVACAPADPPMWMVAPAPSVVPSSDLSADLYQITHPPRM